MRKKYKKCEVDGCEWKWLYGRFCRKHGYRYVKYGDPLGGVGKSFVQSSPGTKCNELNCDENIFAIGLCKTHYRLSKHGKALERMRCLKYRVKKFGMTVDDYFNMVDSQENKCLICGEESKDDTLLSLDHDHNNGKARALLCDLCNKGLGAFKDNADLLEKASLYIRRYNGIN